MNHHVGSWDTTDVVLYYTTSVMAKIDVVSTFQFWMWNKYHIGCGQITDVVLPLQQSYKLLLKWVFDVSVWFKLTWWLNTRRRLGNQRYVWKLSTSPWSTSIPKPTLRVLAPRVARGFDEINKWMKSKESRGLQREAWSLMKILVLELGFSVWVLILI